MQDFKVDQRTATSNIDEDAVGMVAAVADQRTLPLDATVGPISRSSILNSNH